MIIYNKRNHFILMELNNEDSNNENLQRKFSQCSLS